MLFLSAFGAFAGTVEDIMLPAAAVRSGGSAASAVAVYVDPVIGTFYVTNYHVVNGATEFRVQPYGVNDAFPGYTFAYDIHTDLAIIVTPHKVDKIAIIGSLEDVQVTDEVWCVGNTLDHGIVPSKGNIQAIGDGFAIDKFLEGGPRVRTSCSAMGGNSGGGYYAFNEQSHHWELIGVLSYGFAYPIQSPLPGILNGQFAGSNVGPSIVSIEKMFEQRGIMLRPKISSDPR